MTNGSRKNGGGQSLCMYVASCSLAKSWGWSKLTIANQLLISWFILAWATFAGAPKLVCWSADPDDDDDVGTSVYLDTWGTVDDRTKDRARHLCPLPSWRSAVQSSKLGVRGTIVALLRIGRAIESFVVHVVNALLMGDLRIGSTVRCKVCVHTSTCTRICRAVSPAPHRARQILRVVGSCDDMSDK